MISANRMGDTGPAADKNLPSIHGKRMVGHPTLTLAGDLRRRPGRQSFPDIGQSSWPIFADGTETNFVSRLNWRKG